MKNIHILPTDKPSRLFYIKKILVLDRKKKIYSESYKNLHEYKNQNIYITSDEKIKEGNYTYHRVFGVGKITNVNGKKCFVTIKLSSTDGSITTPWKRNIPDIKKIILTTDPQLIADGVQAIDDEFLERFVKNPSCEFAHLGFKSIIGDSETKRTWKIIIPKEEQKEVENDWEEILFDFIDFYPCQLPDELFEWLEENYEIPKKKDGKD